MEDMKPILFNTEMVKAILDGRKTQTRRVIKLNDNTLEPLGYCCSNQSDNYYDTVIFGKDYLSKEEFKTRYRSGDIIYVRETWQKVFDPEWGFDNKPLSEIIINFDEITKTETLDTQGHQGKAYYVYKASDIEYKFPENHLRWMPSIHMPKEAARLFLRVTNVKVERLQDIKENDARNEGCINFDDKIREQKNKDVLSFDLTARDAFTELWDSTIKKADLDKYGWNANPWVWVYEFEVIGNIHDNAELLEVGCTQ